MTAKIPSIAMVAKLEVIETSFTGHIYLSIDRSKGKLVTKAKAELVFPVIATRYYRNVSMKEAILNISSILSLIADEHYYIINQNHAELIMDCFCQMTKNLVFLLTSQRFSYLPVLTLPYLQ